MKNLYNLKRTMHAALFVLLLSVVGMTKGYAQDFNVDDLDYTINDDGVSVTVYGVMDMTYSPLVIPGSVEYDGENYPVTVIGDYAFSRYNNWVSVEGELVIPNSIVTIGEGAFEGCYEITSLTLGNSVVDIKSWAFQECEGLQGSLVIPNSVKSIGDFAFSGSSFTGELVLSNSLKTIGDSAFEWCGFTGELVLPNSLTEIGDGAFSGCGFTGDLVIPNSVKTIGYWAFSSCGFGGSLTLGNSIRIIGDYAFYNCVGLTGPLTIPNSVITIGAGAFAECYGFNGCSLTIGNSVTTIGEGAFDAIGFAGDLVIPSSVTMIGDWAFAGADLEHVIVEQGNTVYDSRSNCNAIIETASNTLLVGSSNTVIPNTVVSIADAAFYYNQALTTMVIPNAVETIGGSVFCGCHNLTSVSISKSVTSIGIGLFSYCENLGQITVEEGNPVFDSRNNCNAIIETSSNTLVQGCKGTVIPNTVQTIGDYAFFYCAGFTGSLTIPNFITTIGRDAFGFCSGFTGSLILGNAVETIGDGAFRGLGVTGNLVIPNSVTTIGKLAFEYCPGLTGSLILGNSVDAIEEYAFGSCSFTSIISLAETPPDLVCGEEYEDWGCYYFNVDVLTVPCGYVSAYEASDWSNYFTTISDDCSHYAILVENTTGGTVSTSVNSAMLGEEVSISCIVDPGFMLNSITVCKADDETMTIPCDNNSFVMPNCDVVVKASFSNTAINENSNAIASIYPNPTNGNVIIEAKGLQRISVYNAIGQLVESAQTDGDVFECDLSRQETGVYLVRMETASGVAVKRVVLTK